MPTITLALDGFTSRGIDKKALPKLVDRLGMSLEEMDDKQAVIEITPDRPDLLEINGLCRALKMLDGKIEPKENQYSLKGAPFLKITIGKGVKKCRPFIAGFVVKGADLTGNKIKELMNFQEKLHETYGRKRKKMSIGIHNLDRIEGDIVYDASKAGEMMPLGGKKKIGFQEVMKTAAEPEWDEIIKGYKAFPNVRDSKKVISIAPVLNCEETRVTESTKNLFVEITGTAWQTVDDTANILACLFIDSGAQVLPCSLVGGKVKVTPTLEYKEFKVSYPKVDRTIGSFTTAKDAITFANRMGYTGGSTGSRILFLVPPYRTDVINERDIIEDIAIGYGYDKISPLPILGSSVGVPDELTEDAEVICQALVGMGFSEAFNTYLTNEKQCFTMVGREQYDKESIVKVTYAKTETFSVLRDSVIPSLLSNLSTSVRATLPQRLFEVGSVFTVEKGKAVETKHASMVIEHAKSNFSEMKGVITELLRLMGPFKIELKEAKGSAFIEGRCAFVVVDGKIAGIFGEIHPKILQNFGLEEPVAAAEIDIEAILGNPGK
jgi:phenylalanyl-tRNA synthetase beta chain